MASMLINSDNESCDSFVFLKRKKHELEIAICYDFQIFLLGTLVRGAGVQCQDVTLT